MNKTGSLSINSENIFPIIKKWLYSDHDIFMRELVSNGCDAITKLKKLALIGDYTMPDDYKGKVEVVISAKNKTMKFIDNGLGMTPEEVEEYITQIAFSGATDFIEKYKDNANGDEIIGHFGLGFYSAFMVADEVHIDTLSYKEGAEPVHWECDGGTSYQMETGNRTTVGTEITLFLNEESLEFANEYRAREVLEKYCSFMPTEIFLTNADAEPQYETVLKEEVLDTDEVVEYIHEDAKTEEKENENGEKEVVEVSPAQEKAKIKKRPVSISDTHPLWTKHPNDCTDEEYLELALAYFLNVGDMKKSLKCLNQMENQTLAVNLKRLIKAYEKQKVPEEAEKFAATLAYLENEWKERSMQSEEKKKQAIQCLIRGYGLLDDKESSEKVLNLVEEGLKTDYLNDSAKRELLQYQASALEKEEKKEEAANIYAEILEDETEPGKREELYKKMVQLYETAGRRDMASDTCIQGIKELGESEELKLTHIRLICADPAVRYVRTQD